jgi:hypothetical protein
MRSGMRQLLADKHTGGQHNGQQQWKADLSG